MFFHSRCILLARILLPYDIISAYDANENSCCVIWFSHFITAVYFLFMVKLSESSSDMSIGRTISTNKNHSFRPLLKNHEASFSDFLNEKKSNLNFFRLEKQKSLLIRSDFFFEEEKKSSRRKFFLIALPTSYIVALNLPTLIRFFLFFVVTLLVSVCSCVCARAPSLVGTKKSTKKTIKLFSNITFV